jgi:hypothetical protein
MPVSHRMHHSADRTVGHARARRVLRQPPTYAGQSVRATSRAASSATRADRARAAALTR